MVIRVPSGPQEINISATSVVRIPLKIHAGHLQRAAAQCRHDLPLIYYVIKEQSYFNAQTLDVGSNWNDTAIQHGLYPMYDILQ